MTLKSRHLLLYSESQSNSPNISRQEQGKRTLKPPPVNCGSVELKPIDEIAESIDADWADDKAGRKSSTGHIPEDQSAQEAG